MQNKIDEVWARIDDRHLAARTWRSCILARKRLLSQRVVWTVLVNTLGGRGSGWASAVSGAWTDSWISGVWVWRSAPQSNICMPISITRATTCESEAERRCGYTTCHLGGRKRLGHALRFRRSSVY